MRIVLTPGGKRRLQARLQVVRAEFDAVVADMPAALESGDTSGWHDNFAFEDNQRRMQQLAHRVRELERIVDSGEVVPPWREAPPKAWVGAAVRWRFVDDPPGLGRSLWLAGYADGDPDQDRVSYDSPLGKALLGAEEGDLCDVVLGGRTRKVEVLEVGPTPAGADAIDLAQEAA